MAKYQEYPDPFYIEQTKDSVGAPDGCYHIHDKYEISICRSGRVHIDTGGQARIIGRACLLLHRPYSIHYVSADDTPYIRRNLYFDADFVAEGFHPIRSSGYSCQTLESCGLTITCSSGSSTSPSCFTTARTDISRRSCSACCCAKSST